MGLEDVQLAERLAHKGIRDARVLAVIARLERKQFLPEEVQAEAGVDAALPIGFGQTISQPYVVAYMTEVLQLRPGEKVLEVGTGSGYQAAVLLELGMEVYSIERVESLAGRARVRLTALGYLPSDLHLRCGDGQRGWSEAAPFDAILVTAASTEVPPALIAQLSLGGRLIAPVGPTEESQDLVLLERTATGITSRFLLPVRFVPLVGDTQPTQ